MYEYEAFFEKLEREPYCDYIAEGQIAVAVSGGPDSMALLFMLYKYASVKGGLHIHALTVDHGLRAESWQEAEAIAQMLKDWPHVTHHILKWDGVKPSDRVQEEARKARYALMESYCAGHGIDGLFLAHHGDDQAETFLFRLAKGSGLNGLSCMREAQKRGKIVLLRPLLGQSKAALVALCEQENIGFVRDPSNESDTYARVRLRQARSVLEEEGLTSKRLIHTAKRLERAAFALEVISKDVFYACTHKNETDCIELKLIALLSYPEEVILRVLKMVRQELFMHKSDILDGYGPREEKFEALLADFINTEAPFQKRTLGGVIFERDDHADIARFTLENSVDR